MAGLGSRSGQCLRRVEHNLLAGPALRRMSGSSRPRGAVGNTRFPTQEGAKPYTFIAAHGRRAQHAHQSQPTLQSTVASKQAAAWAASTDELGQTAVHTTALAPQPNFGAPLRAPASITLCAAQQLLCSAKHSCTSCTNGTNTIPKAHACMRKEAHDDEGMVPCHALSAPSRSMWLEGTCTHACMLPRCLEGCHDARRLLLGCAASTDVPMTNTQRAEMKCPIHPSMAPQSL